MSRSGGDFWLQGHPFAMSSLEERRMKESGSWPQAEQTKGRDFTNPRTHGIGSTQ